MHYISKYVQLYIQVLRISLKTETNVLIFYRKSRRNCKHPVFTEKQWIPVNAPPIGTFLPSYYKRGLSIGSLEWTDSSWENTPVYIFTVKGYN